MGSKTRIYEKNYFLDEPFWGELKFVKWPLDWAFSLVKSSQLKRKQSKCYSLGAYKSSEERSRTEAFYKEGSGQEIPSSKEAKYNQGLYKDIQMRCLQMRSPRIKNILPENRYLRKRDLNRNFPTSNPIEIFEQRSLGSNLMLKQQGTCPHQTG